MKLALLSLSVVLSLAWAVDEPTAAAADGLAVKWEVNQGIKAPESAYFDAASGFLFVSNVGDGGGAQKDGDGFIAKLTPDGKLVSSPWVKSLDAPKGLRSHGGKLWVSDIDRLIGIDIAQGKISDTIAVPGAKFLNDVACDQQGAVYVSDMLASKIYRWRDGKLSVAAAGKELESPNGLLVQGDELIIAAWGLTSDFSTQTPGRLLALDLASGKLRPITPQPTGNLDGVEAVGDAGYLVTDWNAGTVFGIRRGGATGVLLQLPRGAADIGYLPAQKLLIVPQMLENKLTAYAWPPPQTSP